jgi:DNA-binding CsgD family transcriptional regulator
VQIAATVRPQRGGVIKGRVPAFRSGRAATGESLLGTEVVEGARAWFAKATAIGDLTGGERKVLALISEGRSNRQISEALGLAEKRVGDLVSTLLAKLGFGVAGQAVARAIDTGVVNPGSDEVVAVARHPAVILQE